MPTCGEILVNILENYEVDTIFGIPGVHTIELYRGIAQAKLRHITPRHEQGAGFMADGYARSTGKPGVCFIITGPGMTNIITAMGQAMQDSIPMLVVSSVNPTQQLGMGEGRLHELPNQRNLVEGVCRFSHQLTHVDQLPKVLARAFAIFNSERPGPVHIEIPLDVITASAGHLDITPYSTPAIAAPAPFAVKEAAQLLSQAKRPLIAIGGGAVAASKELIALAEKLDAPVINTVNAKGVIPYGHDLAVGSSGSCAVIRKELKAADVVLAVGTEFAETDYDYYFTGNVEVDGTLIRVDIDASQLTRNVKADIAICSDAALAFTAIKEVLSDESLINVLKINGSERAQSMRIAARNDVDIKHEAFFATMNDALPELIIAGDSTQPTYYAWLYYETQAPRRYFHSASGYGTLGYAIPAGIGAKLGNPDKPVVALIGDGAAQFSIGELASAVEAEVSVIFVIWNNIGYGEIRRFMDDVDVEQVGVNIYTPDFVKIAQGFGCDAARPSNLQEFRNELIIANNRKGPTVIEIMEADFVDCYPMS